MFYPPSKGSIPPRGQSLERVDLRLIRKRHTIQEAIGVASRQLTKRALNCGDTVGGLGILGVARALWVRRPGGRCPVAVRGHDRKAIFRRQSALVNANGALQRLPRPAASKLLSRAAVGNQRPNWTLVPTRPPAAPRAAFKSQRDFVSQPKVGAPAPTLGHHPTNLINPNGVAARSDAPFSHPSPAIKQK